MATGTTSSTPTPTTDRRWSGRWTAGRLISTVLTLAVVWNLVGNLWLPGWLYIPANLAIASLLVLVARRAGLSWSELGLARDDVGRGLLYGLAAFVLIGAVLALGLVVPPVEDALHDDSVRDASGFDRWFVPLVRIPLGTALFEEILFRSVLLGGLLLSMRTWKAVAVSSLIFGLWHIVPAWETTEGGAWAITGTVIGTVAITSLGGVLFGTLRVGSRSILAPILAHTATNSLAYAAAIVAIEVLD